MLFQGTTAKKQHLCFHYNPAIISINKVEQLAKNAGAELTGHFGHLLIEAAGVRQPRHARAIENEIKNYRGVLHASVSGTGFIQLEFNKESTSEENLVEQIKKDGLTIVNVEDFHVHEQKEPGKTQKETDQEAKVHKHEHAGLFGGKTELIFAIICGILLGIGFFLSFFETLSPFSIGFYAGAYLFGGYYTTKEAIHGISNKEFEIDFLMLVAAIGAALLGEWAEGALLLFLFSLGHSLEHFAMEKARKSIAALAGLAPKTALLKTGANLTEVKNRRTKNR